MATAYGPSIVTNGLVIALDAANQKSILNSVEVLVVAGGGGGGVGGGGAGGLIYNSAFSISPGTAYTVNIGNGGAGSTVWGGDGSSGANSTFGSLTAIGGGAGNHASVSPSGGSGGGGGYLAAGGAGTAGQGFSGGFGLGPPNYPGGGGGGAGGAGANAISTSAAGAGGAGLQYSISGTLRYYAGGGGGSTQAGGTGGSGGLGGGGAGGGNVNGTAGTTNTGGGGGGGYTLGGAGGSGIVIVRYFGPARATGGTITSVDGFTIHTFTTVGSSTFTPNASWTDLTGNQGAGTLTNGPSYNSSNGSSMAFDGVNDVFTLTPTPPLLQGDPNITVFGFYRRTGDFSSRGFWGIGGSNAGGVGQGLCNWNSSNTNEITIDTWSQSTFTTGQTYPLNTWIGVAWRKTSGPMTRANCIVSIFNGSMTNYTGGALTVLRAEAGTNPIINSIGGLTLGSISVDTGYCAPFNISNHYIYNRVLTDAELLQNFNALRGRYGL
jgi:hypothetical protein